MCVKETDKIEPAGLGFGLGKPDRNPVPQGLHLSNNSTGFEPVFLAMQQHQLLED